MDGPPEVSGTGPQTWTGTGLRRFYGQSDDTPGSPFNEVDSDISCQSRESGNRHEIGTPTADFHEKKVGVTTSFTLPEVAQGRVLARMPSRRLAEPLFCEKAQFRLKP